jgi:hypothetical protein
MQEPPRQRRAANLTWARDRSADALDTSKGGPIGHFQVSDHRAMHLPSRVARLGWDRCG